MADIALSGWYLGNGDPLMDIQNGSLSVPFPFRIGNNGKMGFQLEGGVITVTATSPQLEISFDRPMVYNGDHTHVPGGTPYDIGTPSLAVDARSMTIPIFANAVSQAPNVVSAIPDTNHSIVVTFSEPMDPVTATDPANYSTSGVTITGVTQLSSTQFRLNTSALSPRTVYSLSITGVLDAESTPI